MTQGWSVRATFTSVSGSESSSDFSQDGLRTTAAPQGYLVEVSDYDRPEQMPAVEEHVHGWEAAQARMLQLLLTFAGPEPCALIRPVPSAPLSSPQQGMAVLVEPSDGDIRYHLSISPDQEPS